MIECSITAAEDYVGRFRKGTLSSPISSSCQYFTKWVPRPDEAITRKSTDEAIYRSLSRMKTDQLDLLQFHWYLYCIATECYCLRVYLYLLDNILVVISLLLLLFK